jgi:hypothetical protein
VILQTHPRLRPQIQRWGCYFMSLLWHGVMEKKVSLDPEIIDELYMVFQKHGLMTDSCFIQNPIGILKHLGIDARNVRKTHDSYLCSDNELEILQFKAGGEISHFVAGDSLGNVTYDPYGRSRSVLEGECISKRVFEIRR